MTNNTRSSVVGLLLYYINTAARTVQVRGCVSPTRYVVSLFTRDLGHAVLLWYKYSARVNGG